MLTSHGKATLAVASTGYPTSAKTRHAKGLDVHMNRRTPPRFSAAMAVVLAVTLLLTGPAPVAFASALKVSASARVRSTGAAPSSVVIRATTSRAARVRVAVYRAGRLVRVLKVHKSGGALTATWDLRDASGTRIGLGTCGYRVTATVHGHSAYVSHTFRLAAAALAPAPASTPVPAPQSAPTAKALPAAPPAPTQAVAPAGGSPVAPATALTSASSPAPIPLAAASGSSASRWLGFYVSGNLMPDTSALAALESQTGVHSAVVNMFVGDTDTFPTSRCKALSARSSVPMVTLEFHSATNGGDAAIADGTYDAELDAFADAAKAYGKEVRLRPFHEMNGNWYPWCGTVGGNSPAALIAAWRHIHDLFVSRGATNVKFVWCVNADSVPNTTANKFSAYWPGDVYVDYVAIDAYNFGTYESDSSWRSFASAVTPAYKAVTGLTSKPLFIAETGCVEQGGNKAKWITDMFHAVPASFPRITGVCWFNVLDGEDWRVNSSASALGAFSAVAKAGY